jgi:hypothetical protein
MRLYMNRTIFVMVITLVVMVGVLNSPEIYGQEDITLQKISGIWWTYDVDNIPWAIQFNEDGTFRTALTWLRLERSPTDVGRFRLEGTSLTLISNKDCEGPCKGLKGKYKVKFTENNKLLLKEQEDPCSKRKGACSSPWFKVVVQ